MSQVEMHLPIHIRKENISENDAEKMMETVIAQVDHSSNSILPSEIYFCFYDDKYDKPEFPNKIVLSKPMPTVSDLCSTIKSLFYPGNMDMKLIL